MSILHEIKSKTIDEFFIPENLNNTSFNNFLRKDLIYGGISSIKLQLYVKKNDSIIPLVLDTHRDVYDESGVYIGYKKYNTIKNQFKLTIENKEIYTDNFELKTDIFNNFLIPYFLKFKISLMFNLNEYDIKHEDLFIKYIVEYCHFDEEIQSTLKYQKIEQIQNFNVEYVDVYSREKYLHQDLVNHSLEKIYNPSRIVFNDRIVKIEVIQNDD